MRKCIFSLGFLGILMQCFVTPVTAARPYVTDDPGTTEQGKFELEVATNYWKKDAQFGFVFKHGFTDRAELDIPIGYRLLPEDERAVAFPQAYLKFAFFPDMFAGTFTATIGAPTYAVNLIFSKSISFFKITANMGGSMVGNENDADLTYSASGIFTIGRFETGVEMAGTQEGLQWWQAGAKFFFTDWLSLDSGIGGDFSKNISVTATTGLWFSFPIPHPENKGE